MGFRSTKIVRKGLRQEEEQGEKKIKKKEQLEQLIETVIKYCYNLASEASHSLVMSTGARDIYIYIRLSIASRHN